MPPGRPASDRPRGAVGTAGRQRARRGRRPGAAVEAALAAAKAPAPAPTEAPKPKRAALAQLPWSSERPDVGDHTRLVLRKRNRTMLGTAGTLIVIAILAAVLVLPIRTWVRQRGELADRKRELAAMNQANVDLQTENDRLRTPEGVMDAARQDLGLIVDGEQVIAMLPAPVSEEMPAGWPYSLVGQILAARAASAVAPATTVTPNATQDSSLP